MAPNKRQPDDDRAKKTLYVTGFNPKLMKRHLLKELFCQGGPVVDVTLFETHAYILFQHVDSVPYCLALFHDIEMFGDRLRLKPRSHSDGNVYSYLDYLAEVRSKLREEYSKVKPPNLPAKKYSNGQKSDRPQRRDRHNRRSVASDNRSSQEKKDPSSVKESENHSQTSTTNTGPNIAANKQSSPKTSSKRPAPAATPKSTSNSRKRKRGGKRKTVGNKKLQKRIKFLA